MSVRIAALCCFAASVVVSGRGHAQQASYGQYLVVLDDSGSMDQSDPGRLVVLASTALAAALEDGDQVMIVGLNELASGAVRGPAFRSPRELVPDRDGTEGVRPLASARAQAIARHGGQTPCRAALERARSILEAVAGAGAPQTLLMLTDGACNGGAVEGASQWLPRLRSHREGRFRFVLMMREGRGRPDPQLVEYGRATGWDGDVRVAFDMRALLRAFAGVLSFSRGLRYDDGGRIGLERTFAGARHVRALAIREQGPGPIAIERVDAAGTNALTGGPTFRADALEGNPTWSFRVATETPREVPYAVRTPTSGAEVLVIPVYGRLRVEAVVVPCGERPGLPWTHERAVRAGQPACAWARLVGDAGDTIHPGRSFEFAMSICQTPECTDATAMQPDADGTFNAVLGDLSLGRHERTFRASGGTLAFPVVAQRGIASMAFGVQYVADAEAPEVPVRALDLGALPTAQPTTTSLIVHGAFPAGTRAQVTCAATGAAAECFECALADETIELQDRATIQLTMNATPFCQTASDHNAEGALELTAELRLAPTSEQVSPFVLPIRGSLGHAHTAPIEITLAGAESRGFDVLVPGTAALLELAAEPELDADVELVFDPPGDARADENGVTALHLEATAEECCSAETYEGVVHLRAGESELRVPLRVTVTDPGFWVCPGRKILRWTLLVLGILLLVWIVRGFLGPAKFNPGANLLYAESHEALNELRDGDDGWKKLERFVETKRGFRRAAALHLGGKRAPLPSLKRQPDDGRIEAQDGGGATLIVTGPGVERFTESGGWEELAKGSYPVSSRITLRRGELYLQFQR